MQRCFSLRKNFWSQCSAAFVCGKFSETNAALLFRAEKFLKLKQRCIGSPEKKSQCRTTLAGPGRIPKQRCIEASEEGLKAALLWGCDAMRKKYLFGQYVMPAQAGVAVLKTGGVYSTHYII